SHVDIQRGLGRSPFRNQIADHLTQEVALPNSTLPNKHLDEAGSLILFQTLQIDGSGVSRFQGMVPKVKSGNFYFIINHDLRITQKCNKNQIYLNFIALCKQY